MGETISVLSRHACEERAALSCLWMMNETLLHAMWAYVSKIYASKLYALYLIVANLLILLKSSLLVWWRLLRCWNCRTGAVTA
jgi:succinylarginine dihydrolase